MITSFHLRNFKAWRDTGRVRLAPLTVLFGANSAGKSSLGHWLLALKQTAQSTDRRRALHLGDDRSLVDLGTYRDCLHGHDLSRPLDFSLRWSLPTPLTVIDPLTKHAFSGNELGVDCSLMADRAEQPEIHLHPEVQANLADLFIDAIQAQEDAQPREVQLIVESHSEHMLNRLQRRIAERRLGPRQVAIYSCAPGAQGATMERLHIDSDGEIGNCPDNFFGDEMADIVGRTLAAIAHGNGSSAE